MAQSLPTITVCTPVSISEPRQLSYFRELLVSYEQQDYVYKEILISDDSENSTVEEICKEFGKRGSNIKYVRTDQKGIAKNLNNVVNLATGDVVKILFQDDFFYSETALSDVSSELMASDKRWFVSACNHYSQTGQNFYEDFYPRKTSKLVDGFNSISSPSVVSFYRTAFEPFEVRLTYLVDCEWYLRMSHKHGLPIFGKKVQITNRVHESQATNWAKELKGLEVQLTKLMHTNPKMGTVVCSCL